MNRLGMMVVKVIVAAALISLSFSVSAYLLFFGEDLNNSNTSPLQSFPNASQAQELFLTHLLGVDTEDFEGVATGQGAPLTLVFPGAGDATLLGGSGEVNTITPGETNGVGRYATSGSNYWEVEAGASGNFHIEFTVPTAAFGFFGIDIGDFGGQFLLNLAGNSTTNIPIPNTMGVGGSTDGSVLYQGLIAENSDELFTRVEFNTNTGSGDFFAFDDMTVGDFRQVGALPVPEPGTLILMFLVVIGFAWKALQSRRLNASSTRQNRS